MVNWNYDARAYEENKKRFDVVDGDYRVRIESAEEKTSSSGNDMIVFDLALSGTNLTISYYLTLLEDNPDMTNRMIGSMAESFCVVPDITQFRTWVGKYGAVRTMHDEYGVKVRYFLNGNRKDALPAWKEPENSRKTGNKTEPQWGNVNVDTELPFV